MSKENNKAERVTQSAYQTPLCTEILLNQEGMLCSSIETPNEDNFEWLDND